MTTTTEQVANTPRTPEQVRFTPDLPWEQQVAMYRQSLADGGLTMTYSARAREVLACAATAADGRLDPWALVQLEAIGRLLVIWEGSLVLLEERLERIDGEHAARGELLDVAGAEIRRLRALATNLATSASAVRSAQGAK